MELWYLISVHHLMMLYFCTKFQEHSQRVSELSRGCSFYTEIFNSVNSVGGVMALILSTLSDGVLYLYQVCRSIS